MGNITNADILENISEVKVSLGRLEEKVSFVARQAEKTNGRVNKVEEWMNLLKATDRLKKEQHNAPVISTKEGNVVVQQPPASYWENKGKLYIALAALATATASAISFFVGSLR